MSRYEVMRDGNAKIVEHGVDFLRYLVRVANTYGSYYSITVDIVEGCECATIRYTDGAVVTVTDITQ